MNRENSDKYRIYFSLALAVLSLVLFLFAVYLFFEGWSQYTGNQNLIDHRLKLIKPEDTMWLVLLFAMPLLAEFIGSIFVLPKVHKDKSLIIFYGFCLFIMTLCPLSYCWLWKLYTSGNYNQDYYSYVALVFIVILLIPVGLMTYAIMWSPSKEASSEDWEFSEDDIQNWHTFCLQLKNSGSLSALRQRILEFMPPKVSEDLRCAKDISDFDKISKPEIIRGLNKILKSRDLHLAVDLDQSQIAPEAKKLLERSRDGFSESEVRQLNHLLLKACHGTTLNKEPPPSNGGGRIFKRVVRTWENYLRDLRDGVEKVQFWVLVFFFTVFMGITYLFGFAFAFHDQRVMADEKAPALYMAKSGHPAMDGTAHESSVVEQQEPDAVLSPDFTFYFSAKSAIPPYKYTAFDPKAYGKDIKRRNEDWRAKKNIEHLDQISKAILESTNNGEGLRIELRGGADDSDLREGTTYSSNYALSEARAQNIKYVMMNKLSEQDKKQRNIEWFSLPLSSELSLAPPLAQHKGEEAEENERSGEEKSTQIIKGSLRQRQALQEEQIQSEVRDLMLNLSQGDNLNPEEEKFLAEKVKAVVQAASGGGLSSEHKQSFVDRLKAIARIMKQSKNQSLTQDGKTSQLSVLTRKKNELKESLEALKYVDIDAGKRVVIASLIPIQNNNQFRPLSLMDYMYFTIYTITTTGYGDISPKTTYAKFLCSLANILEVFFLVVFFNALLSVRGGGKLARVSDSE